jgi:hypothetical protein
LVLDQALGCAKCPNGYIKVDIGIFIKVNISARNYPNSLKKKLHYSLV